MNRREFVKFIGLIAAGASARPEQIEAFTHYYEVNAPKSENLIAVDEVFLSGTANRSMVITMNLYRRGELYMPISFNAFGSTVRWIAASDQKILNGVGDTGWNITGCVDILEDMTGFISYIDSDGVRHNRVIETQNGRL